MTIQAQIRDIINGKIKKAVTFGLRKQFLNDQAETLKDLIVKRTRLRRGVDQAGNTTTLAGLKRSTINQRTRYRGNLSTFTTPARSNITATGQLLDSFKATSNNNELIVTAKENRRTNLQGKPSTVKHADIIKGLESGNIGRNKTTPRPFFRASNAERNEIARNIRQEILKGLK